MDLLMYKYVSKYYILAFWIWPTTEVELLHTRPRTTVTVVIPSHRLYFNSTPNIMHHRPCCHIFAFPDLEVHILVCDNGVAFRPLGGYTSRGQSSGVSSTTIIDLYAYIV